VIDTRTCPRCRALLLYSRRFYSHIGHWACSRCDFARPDPAVKAANVTFDGLDATHFTLMTPEGEREVTVPLPGLYNVYNALAAVAAGLDMGVAVSAAGDALARFVPAFGRAERISVEGRDVRLLLAKNPTGLNEVLRALAVTGERPYLLLLLNDRAADGEDVSWIWDANLEQAQRAHPRHVTVGGTRAYDLALRLKYAGSAPQAIEPEIANALRVALEHTPVGETLYVAPTYTALLEVRGELERHGFAPRYWEQRDA
jgi:UDP-N-acetylmuramyl tripeptide synthase